MKNALVKVLFHFFIIEMCVMRYSVLFMIVVLTDFQRVKT